MNDAMVKLKDSVIDGRKIYLRREVDMRDHDPSFNVYIGNLPFRGFEDEQLDALVLTFRPYFCRVKVKRGRL